MINTLVELGEKVIFNIITHHNTLNLGNETYIVSELGNDVNS